MRKYCFTDCFKRKMSKLGKGIVEFILGIIIMLSIVVVFILFAFVLGLIDVNIFGISSIP